MPLFQRKFSPSKPLEEIEKAVSAIAKSFESMVAVERLRENLEEHKRETRDQYNSAYARTAEQYYNNSLEEFSHRRWYEQEMLKRWEAHADSLQEQIALLKQENVKLTQMVDRFFDQNSELRDRLNDTPRISQVREWMSELLSAIKSKEPSDVVTNRGDHQ